MVDILELNENKWQSRMNGKIIGREDEGAERAGIGKQHRWKYQITEGSQCRENGEGCCELEVKLSSNEERKQMLGD